MDYYGAPRAPPKPPTINTLHRIPVVPEVSIVDNSFNPALRNFNLLSKENSFLCPSKKQVRFNEPNSPKENIPQTLKTAPDLNGKTFKQIYMANVPDRHLDLSIFEAPKNRIDDSLRDMTTQMCNTKLSDVSSTENNQFTHKCKEKLTLYDSSKQFPSFNKNYVREPRINTPPRRAEVCIQTDPIPEEKCNEIANSINEPTIKDLFRIIQQQNEQIMLLQRQVNNLMRQPEADRINNSPTKKGLFSFDVKATSFEFSFRPQHKFRKQSDFLEPKIQEIVESNSDENPNSLHLDESVDVKDSYVSNVPSIAIEMDEYHSSDEDQEQQVGLSFYKDLMDQVNNALKKVQQQSECQETPGQTMKAVKQATLQHLRNIGVNLSPIQESSEVTGGSTDSDLDQSEVSCAVQQLLMKYLPSDKLAKVTNKPKLPKIKRKLNPPNTEFSFATLQYMKKYNLINSKSAQPEKKTHEPTPKILDVTALKLQPKLL